jgi:hypothetical protein
VPKKRPARVVIGGHWFELGVVYAPRNGFGRPRLLLAYEPDSEWLGGRVETRLIGQSGSRRDPVCGTWWARWAGEPVVGLEDADDYVPL